MKNFYFIYFLFVVTCIVYAGSPTIYSRTNVKSQEGLYALQREPADLGWFWVLTD